MEKQKILYQQARLHARGAAEMVLQMISASKGSHRLISCSKMTFPTSTQGCHPIYVLLFTLLKKQLFVLDLCCVEECCK